MSHAAAVSDPATPEFTPIPFGRLVPWALFVGILALLALYFVSAEQGAIAFFGGTGVHEWVHDGRHLLAFPCH